MKLVVSGIRLVPNKKLPLRRAIGEETCEKKTVPYLAPVRTALLEQARETVWPKVFDQGSHIEAQDVLNAIYAAIAKDQLFVFPGKGTRMAQRLRRWMPGMIWKNVHQTEGFQTLESCYPYRKKGESINEFALEHPQVSDT